MIKIRTPKLEEGFVGTAVKSYLLFLQKMSELEKNGDKRTPAKYASAIARLLPIVRKKSPSSREGFDYEVTRFKGLEYERLFMFSHKGREYLVGQTRHIELRDWKNGEVKAQLGKYRVFIPVDIFVTDNLYDIHLVPMRNPKAEYRHPHQAAPDTSVHPLERSTSNCYGDYQPTMIGMLHSPDMPELMRQFYRHLRTYGDRPPYRLSMDFDITTGENYEYPDF